MKSTTADNKIVAPPYESTVRVRGAALMILAVVSLVIFRLHTASVAIEQIPRSVRHIVILGDSVAHGAGDESGRGISGDLAALRVQATNLGINGARTHDVRKLIRLAGTKAAIRCSDAVILSIGGNDLFGDRLSKLQSLVWPSMMMGRTVNDIDRIAREIHRLNPAARVYLLGLYNPYRSSRIAVFLDRQVALWDSRLIAHFADQANVDVVRIADLFSWAQRLSSVDHFHPSKEAYALIAQRIAMTW